MDSGNSGSLQSSSGGDATGADGIPILQPPSNFFHPSSFSQPLNQNPNPNPMYNLDPLWSITQTPNPNPVYDPVDKLGVTIKTPKKRTRASRRAPTTVLTTDTTNFRQMVQEFTGIPTAPFSAASSSSPFARRRDLYGGGGAPLHPLRPSAQKIQPLYLSSVTTTTSGFQLPSSETQMFTKQPLNLSNLSNLQNQMFSFQSYPQGPQSSLLQQANITGRENQRLETTDEVFGSSSTSMKRWRGEDESLMNFEGRSGNLRNAVVQLRNEGDQDQLPGDEDSWICPSD